LNKSGKVSLRVKRRPAANADEHLFSRSILLIRSRFPTPTPREIAATTWSPLNYTGAESHAAAEFP
jgi:hypothetical protein